MLPLRRQTLTGRTVDTIRERILRGHYPEGEPLRQEAIGAELGVSRIPVREALRQLEAEGLVEFHPHAGAVVSALSLRQIGELFDLLAEIESDLIQRAVPLMRARDHDRIKQLLEAREASPSELPLLLWGPRDWRFHSMLYAPAERDFTIGVVSRLHQQSDRYLRMQPAQPEAETRARLEHRAIAAAAEARDSVTACGLMRDHILNAGRSLVGFLERTRAQHATSL